MLTDTHTRVTVQVPGHTVDIALTKQSSVAGLLTDVVPYLRESLANHEDVAQWRRVSTPCPADEVAATADAEAARIEAAYTKDQGALDLEHDEDGVVFDNTKAAA